eukprot:14116709-Alexandrium_andersonii.AAC.1
MLSAHCLRVSAPARVVLSVLVPTAYSCSACLARAAQRSAFSAVDVQHQRVPCSTIGSESPLITGRRRCPAAVLDQ